MNYHQPAPEGKDPQLWTSLSEGPHSKDILLPILLSMLFYGHCGTSQVMKDMVPPYHGPHGPHWGGV